MKRIYILVFLIIIVYLTFSCKHKPEIISGLQPNDTTSPLGIKCSQDTTYFENEVLPIFISNCAKSGCHDVASAEEDVILNNYQNIFQTGEIVPGDPDESKIYLMITETDPEKKMPPPPLPSLTSTEIQSLRKWILQGAKNNRCDSINCDTNNVTYAFSLKPIVDLNCKGCHSGTVPSGGIDLSTSAGLQGVGQSGQLLGALNQLTGYSPMPKGGNKLVDCQITMFEKWITSNYPKK